MSALSDYQTPSKRTYCAADVTLCGHYFHNSMMWQPSNRTWNTMKGTERNRVDILCGERDNLLWTLATFCKVPAGRKWGGNLEPNYSSWSTVMREIIHIQAGPLSNYTGTHYWNAQENYFVYDEGDIAIIDHNISFKEGRDDHVRLMCLWRPILVIASTTPNSQNQPTLCPRLLAFDRKCASAFCNVHSRVSSCTVPFQSKFWSTCKGFASARGSDQSNNLVSSSSPVT